MRTFLSYEPPSQGELNTPPGTVFEHMRVALSVGSQEVGDHVVEPFDLAALE